MKPQELYQYIEKNHPNICQISILQYGKEVWSGEWNGYKKTDCAHIASATKSVMSLLIGIAIDKGYIGSVDDTVLSYFPDYRVKRGEKTIYDVTIKHLLTMRAPFKGQGDPWTKVCSSSDWSAASLDFLGGSGGITDKFSYRTVCLHILSGVLSKATGMNTVDFANQYLFKPLGIPEHENCFVTSAEEHRSFITDKAPKRNVWLADSQGVATPGYGLCMSASDMAKIGQLCLQNGIWNGQQIVSSSWIAEICNPRTIEEGRLRGMHYGYLWWIVHPEKNIYAAIGDSGNVIYVDQSRNVVVAVSSYFKPTVSNRVEWIENVLVPLINEILFSGVHAMNYIRITKENIGKEHICCAMSGKQSIAKKEWMKQRLDEGLVFYRSEERGKCFIEYIPAENAWVPIDADGYLYINCLWVSGSMKGHGYSGDLLNECIRDAKAQEKKGICILCAEGRKREFLADPKYLTHKGFQVADISDCGINLMYLPLSESAEPPKFKVCAKHLQTDGDGFVLYYTDQCPFTYYWVPRVEEAAKEHGISLETIHITTKEAAQNVPAPVTTYALFRDGKFVTQGIQSDKKFLALAGVK